MYRPPLRSYTFVLKNIQIPYSVSTEYCKVIHVQTLPEELFMCANLQPNRKHGIQQGSGSCTGLSIHSSAVSSTHKLAFILDLKESEGNCCKLTRGAGKKVTFLQNLTMRNSCIQVCVSSYKNYIRLTVTIPGFAFCPTEKKIVIPVRLGYSCDNKGHEIDTVTEA